ncbi:MAG: hypothetical protein JW827_05575 [Spirochaetes bacterium]|nr:hypothetical protein [Spirochaetota bacterium]
MRHTQGRIICIFTFFLFLGPLSAQPYQEDDEFTAQKPFILFHFNKKENINSVNGGYGAFDLNPHDLDAYCRLSYKRDNDLHKQGYHLRVSYDVESDEPAFNGFWTKLQGIDLSKFEAISLKIKGVKEKGFSDFFKIELKDKSIKIETDIENITSGWQTIIIPFKNFQGDLEDFDFSSLNEFTMVFEDWRLKKKVGRYYIDDISFIPEKGVAVEFGDIIKKTKDFRVQIDKNDFELAVNIDEGKKKLFKNDNSLSDEGKKVLDEVISSIKDDNYKRVIIIMFKGKNDKDVNRIKSQAKSIYHYLIEKGVDMRKLNYRIYSREKDVTRKRKCKILIIRWKEGEEELFKKHFFNGMDAFLRQGYSVAVEEWEKALKIDPDNEDLVKRIKEAKQALKK